jgi:hypothetical protein
MWGNAPSSTGASIFLLNSGTGQQPERAFRFVRPILSLHTQSAALEASDVKHP